MLTYATRPYGRCLRTTELATFNSLGSLYFRLDNTTFSSNLAIEKAVTDLISVFAPKEERTRHWRWLKQNHHRLPITGFDGLLKQEVIAFVLPSIAAGIVRLGMGQIGWEDWDSIPSLGEKLLIIAFIYWVLWDFRRVMRTRRSLKKMAKMNLERVKRRVERALAGRDFLRNIEEFRIPRPWSPKESLEPIEGEEFALEKPEKIKSVSSNDFKQSSGFNRFRAWLCDISSRRFS